MTQIELTNADQIQLITDLLVERRSQLRFDVQNFRQTLEHNGTYPVTDYNGITDDHHYLRQYYLVLSTLQTMGYVQPDTTDYDSTTNDERQFELDFPPYGWDLDG